VGVGVLLAATAMVNSQCGLLPTQRLDLQRAVWLTTVHEYGGEIVCSIEGHRDLVGSQAYFCIPGSSGWIGLSADVEGCAHPDGICMRFAHGKNVVGSRENVEQLLTCTELELRFCRNSQLFTWEVASAVICIARVKREVARLLGAGDS
jgi:hypothetical protein